LVERYLRGEDGRGICRRVVLDEYLDRRRDQEGYREGEEKCDVYRGREGEGEEKGEEEKEEEEGEEEEGNEIKVSSRAFERREFK